MFRLERGFPKRLPHVHHRKSYLLAFLWSQPGKELIHALFRTVFTTKPDRAAAQKITDNDPIGVPLAYGNFVHPNDLGSWNTNPAQLLAHVLLVQLFDSLPIQVRFLSHVFDRHRPATPPHKEPKPLAVKRIVREPIELLLLHFLAPRAIDPTYFDVQIDSIISTPQVADPTALAIVPSPLDMTAGTANRFFPRRCSCNTRAFGSPKIPCTVEPGRKPGKR